MIVRICCLCVVTLSAWRHY